MTPTETPVRILREDPAGFRFIVAGDKRGGRVPHRCPSGLPAVMDYHSPRPQFSDGRAFPCDVIAGECYPEAGAGVAALRAAWLQAGSDDEVIWLDLEKRYAQWEAEG